MAEHDRGSRSTPKSHPAAKDLFNKSFPHYDELLYVFGKDRAMGDRAETFTDFWVKRSCWVRGICRKRCVGYGLPANVQSVIEHVA
uniref:Uncharacterized protein n=1 Tax=Cucumis melo TaxID=3656 RepID=A0A9I9EDD4_CUCME